MVILDGIEFEISPVMGKKYRAIFSDGKKVDFGSTKYQHYYDRIGMYPELNHYDVQRRINYITRHASIKKSDGTYAVMDKKSPAYLSMHYLW